MSFHKVFLGTLLIASGQTTSNILSARELTMARGLLCNNPSAFTGTVTLQIAPHDDSATGAFKAFSQAGADVTLTANKMQGIETPAGCGEAIRVVSGSSEAADRSIDVYVMLEI